MSLFRVSRRLTALCAFLAFGYLSSYAASSSSGSAQGTPNSSATSGSSAPAGSITPAVVPTQDAALSSPALSSAAKSVIERAFTLKDRAKIVQALETGAAKQSAPADKKGILAALASYEERIGAPDAAARHYAAAATADPAARDDSLLLDAARASLAANDTEAADGYVRTVLLTGTDDWLLARSRVYAAWIGLAKGDDPQALSLIRALAQGKAFAPYAPALLFTLWWASGDAVARDTLIATYPASPEAAVASGSMSLAPAPFWYLMGRNPGAVASFALEGTKNLPKSQSSTAKSESTAAGVQTAIGQATSGGQASAAGTSGKQPVSAQTTAQVDVAAQTAGTASDSVSGVWQQVGFFKSRENADELVARLERLGFKPVVRGDKRPSGTVYFAVLVPEDKGRTVAGRLKDSGFESYLVTDAQ